MWVYLSTEYRHSVGVPKYRVVIVWVYLSTEYSPSVGVPKY